MASIKRKIKRKVAKVISRGLGKIAEGAKVWQKALEVKSKGKLYPKGLGTKRKTVLPKGEIPKKKRRKHPWDKEQERQKVLRQKRMEESRARLKEHKRKRKNEYERERRRMKKLQQEHVDFERKWKENQRDRFIEQYGE